MQGRVVAGKYELEALLGQGGVGQVWRARHRVTKRAHAVKIISGERDTEAGLERFLREAESFAHVRHPGVVEILDAGRDADGTLYLVMELLEGRTFRQWLDTEGRRPWEGADILHEALDPLTAAHEARDEHGGPSPIVHRDLKPENLFVLDRPVAPPPGRTQPTRVKLLDFGIARWVGTSGPTAVGMTLGTPLYASPEQLRDPRSVTARADVWSMGVMLHEIFSGTSPFMGKTYFEVVAKIWDEPPPPLPAWAPAPLVQLVTECLAKDPMGRPADARAMARRMDVLLKEAAGAAVPASSMSRSARPKLDQASDLATGSTEPVLPLVRARVKTDPSPAERAPVALVAAPVVPVSAPVSVRAASPARALLEPAAPASPSHESGSRPAGPRLSSPLVIPNTRAAAPLAPEEAAALAEARRAAPIFTAPREPAVPASRPAAAAAASSVTPASAPGVTTPASDPPTSAPSSVAPPRFSVPTSASPSPSPAQGARAAFSQDEPADASALPGYGRLRVGVVLAVLTVLGTLAAGAAWYLLPR